MSTTYLFVAETVDSIRSKFIGYLQAAGSTFSNWIAGGIAQQIVEADCNTIQGVTTIMAQAIRGFASLDSSTDPGDYDPYDPVQQTLEPAPGFLSDNGSNNYGTDRIGQTPAATSIAFANIGSGAVNQNLGAFTVTFQRNYANADGTVPTYQNSAPIVCAAGLTVTVPIVAQSPGSASSASANTIVIMVTVLPGVTVTNPSAAVGLDRQSADDYRAACREAAALASPNGPADAYRYLATTGKDDGTWGNSTTGNSLGISRIQISGSSSTGIVNVYYAGPSGGAGLSGTVLATTGPMAGMTFVQAANYLITLVPGVISVFDCLTFVGAAATDVAVPIVYALSMKASAVPGAVPGTYSYTSTPGTAQATVFLAIDAAYEAFFAAKDIGGDNQTAGAGVIYTEDLRGVLYQIQLASGVNLPAYNVSVTTPSGSTTALAVGQDATYGGAATSTVTFV